MTSAALALCLALLVHSAHCDGACQGQDGTDAPNSFVLGPYYKCLTNGTLRETCYTYTERRYVQNVRLFGKDSDETIYNLHCPHVDWSDEEW